MAEKLYDVIVVGGGPAGLAAAVGAKEAGAKDVLIVERDVSLGGILQQCIHPGFGLKYFNAELSGPEYAYRFIEKVKELFLIVCFSLMFLLGIYLSLSCVTHCLAKACPAKTNRHT